ncbi:hypothetical protein G3N95_22410 [Paraburkholderia sp. Tr-20389]|uniref:hypothetical protein n=1 Tax=Paraburkholderia sp. Tr-20389 TaxID=2703903 RepID=UPI00197EBB97|nr:hypothetical protein [Paraburkholderia sp. Tr-20389]MBN3755713.1 hypothetical protein [Paraburkholderia sp. Tr-20389]
MPPRTGATPANQKHNADASNNTTQIPAKKKPKRKQKKQKKHKQKKAKTKKARRAAALK